VSTLGTKLTRQKIDYADKKRMHEMRRTSIEYKEMLEQLQFSDWEYQNFHPIVKADIYTRRNPWCRTFGIVGVIFAGIAGVVSDGALLATATAATMLLWPVTKAVKDAVEEIQYRKQCRGAVAQFTQLLPSAPMSDIRQLLNREREYLVDWMLDPEPAMKLLAGRSIQDLDEFFEMLEVTEIAVPVERKTRLYAENCSQDSVQSTHTERLRR